MTVEYISLSISTEAWDRVGIELKTPGSAIYCPMGPSDKPLVVYRFC